jgi:Ca2+-binding RTX toxin-like protein
MQESKVRVGVRASVAEGSVWERVSGEQEKPFGLCQPPTLTGVGNHHSLFGLLGFRGISDPVVAGAINTLVLEPSSVLPDPSSLDPEPSSVLPDSSSRDAEPSSVKVSASVKYVTLESGLSENKTSTALSAAGKPAFGATATKLDLVATKEADFAPLSKVDPSTTSNLIETSALAAGTKLVGDVFIHGSAIPVPGSSNQTAADSRSDISALPAQDSSIQITAEDSRSDISAIPAQDSSVQIIAQDTRSDSSALPAQDLSVQITVEDLRSDISAIPAQDSSVQIVAEDQTTAEDPRADINDWSAGWRAAVGDQWGVFCCGMCGSVKSPGGLDGGQPVLNNTVDLGLLSDAGSAVSGTQSADALDNPIVRENMLQGSPQSEWGIDGGGDANIEGFATDISVDNGHTVSFKINTDSTHYRIDIYRIGYYGGDGAHKVATIDKSLPTAQNQPIPLFDPATKLVDAGNWSVSATWDVPQDAVSGVYFAKLTRLDGVAGANIIPFIVRDDEHPSDITFQTSDTTWEAYNPWGGYNLYGSIDGPLNDSRASAVSYNRPIITRGGGVAAGPQDFIFGVEYPAIRWLEENGYNVNYISGVDTARDGAQLLNSKIFLSVGHDEYWSGSQYANVMAARDAGVNLAFWSGNEVYWRTRWETSIDGSGTPYRTLVTYKEIRSGANTDPIDTTSTWRDPVYGPGLPENSLTGTMFTVDSYRLDTMKIPYALSNFRFWSNTAVADLQPGQVYSLTPNLLGYEWDSDVDNGFRPAGLINLSSTTLQVEQKLLDYGTTTGDGTATHALTLYRAASGALVFGAGTVYWAWGLDDNHDLEQTPIDPNVQQAMVNLFTDMGVQPDTLMASLVLASQSTDHTAPTSTVTTPGTSATLPAFSPITITGTAADTGGGIVAVVEVSTDNGTTWHRANGFENWTYSWTPIKGGTYTIKSRAVDDSVNMEAAGAGVTVTVNQPLTRTLFTGNEIPAVQTDTDPNGVNLGVKFVATQAGTIVGVKYYKGILDTSDHVGSLWSSTGTLLASATFTNESTSGWQTAIFSNPVTVTGGTPYVVSYHSNGHYADTTGFFADTYGNGPLSVAGNASGTGNSYFAYGNANAFPITSAGGTNYWVDVLYVPAGNGVNHAPSPTNDAAFTQRNTALNIAGSQLLANDSDADGDVLSVSGVGGAVGGTVSYNAQTNTATFIPTQDFQGAASFNYSATDGQVATTGTVNVAVVAPFMAEGLFTSSQTPDVLSDPDPAQVNLGVKFVASEAGSIAGLEYYRGTGDTGTHTGSLWSSTGQLLATATFAAETASGWQTVNFSSPVTIAPDTTYVASYHSNGHYAATGNYFGAIYTNGSLATAGPAASVYTYGAGNLFPTNTSNANYWVDVLFVSSGAPVAVNDSGFTTPQGTALEIPTATLLANDRDPNNDPLSFVNVVRGVGGSPTYNAQTGKVTFAPDPGFIGAATFTYQITDGTNDPASASVNLTVLPPASTAQLFAYSDTPAVLSDPDSNSVNLGVKFLATEAGAITGLKYYKGAGDTGTHVGTLWASTGTLLASATFTNESASGWQYVTFANSVSISAGTTYVASYHSNGHYTDTGNYFTSTYTNGALATPGPAAGVYAYGPNDLFPTSTSSANYWVDVLFVPSGAPIAVNDKGFTTSRGTALEIPGATLLANDTDPNGDPLSVAAVGSQLGGTVSLASNAVTFTPTPGYIGAASFAYQITDGSHTSVPATVELTVLPAPTTAQLFTSTDSPANLSDPDPAQVNLGVKFDSSQSGLVTGLKYYKGIGDTGTHVGSLWTSDGTLLASATFTNETASGWQYVTFANPVAITAGTTYVASYSSNGHYASTGNFFTTEYTNGILSTSGPNASVYTYGTGTLFPISASTANYWVDVLLDPPAGPNAAPVISSPATASFPENAVGTVLTVTATDPDAGQTLSYTIIGGADAAKFTLNGTTGALAFVTAPDFEAPTDSGANNVYDVTVQVSDGNGGIATQAVAVTVTNQNEVPTVTSNGGGDTAAASIAENTTVVTTVAATDPDVGQTLSYSIVGGADAGKFTINATTGALAFVTAPDFEAPTDTGANNVYDVTVQVSDGSGGIDTQAVAVTVTNQNELPAITSNGGGDSAAASIAENTMVVTTVAATDPDAGQTLSYAIIGGADAAKFTINGTTGALAFVTAPDFEAPTDSGANNVYDVTVQVSDGSGGIDTQAIAVTVQNVTGATINGTNLAETLTGTGEEDIINALGGDDTLNGAGGADTMVGGLGNDTYVVDNAGDVVTENANEGIDTVQAAVTYTLAANVENLTLTGTGNINGTGNPLGNVLTGNSGANVLTGLDGNDTLAGGGGADTLDGGAGTDTASYAASSSGVAVSLAAGTSSGGDAGGDTLISIENLTGSGLNDTLEGDGANNILNGGAGTDTVSYENAGAAVTVSLAVGTAQNTSGAGTDTLSGFENLMGSAFDDALTGSTAANVLMGLAGNDTLNGGAGIDTLIGGVGNDTYVVDNAGDVVTENANEGIDRVQAAVTYTLAANVENLTLTGTGNINGTGNALDNVVVGNSGNNILAGLGGSDTLDGGAGTDTASYAASSSGVTVSLAAGTSSGGDAGGDTLISFENLTGSGLNDTLEGDGANNILNGGAGTDTVSYENAGAAVTVSLAVGTAQNTSGAGTDTLSGFENLMGSAFDDALTGSTAANVLMGLAGNDTLNGGAGIDTLIGGVGNDTYVVDNAGDVVTENANEGIDRVQAAVTYTLAANVENLTLTGTGNINGTGNALDNVVVGNSGNNILAGLGGSDTLDGGAGTDTASYAASSSGVTVSLAAGTSSGGDAGGDTLISIENLTGSGLNDTLEGDGANNVLNGGAGTDTVSYEHAGAAVTVSLAIGTAQNTGGAGTDTLSGFENLMGSAFDDALTGTTGANVLTGLAGNDTLNGGAGADTLVGGAGNDTLVGGSGADILTGGLDADRFVFSALGDSAPGAPDSITDFTHGTDLIDLSAIDANTSLSGNQAFVFSGQNANVVPLSVTWFESGGNTIIRADVNGNTTADFMITLTGTNHNLSASDFIL